MADTSDTTKTYYRYDNGLYIEANSDYITANPTKTYYVVDSYGTSHIVMKKMAYLPVADLGNRMEDVINDLYLKDLMDIYEFDVIEESNTSDESWFIPYDDDYTEFVEKEGGEIDTYNYAFILDGDGKYYLRETMHFALNEAQTNALKDGGAITFGYKQLTSANKSMLESLFLAGNGYFKDEKGNYHHNPALCSYISLNDDTANFENVYVRDEAGTAYSLPTYDDANGLLFVKIFGAYIPYSATNPVHADLEKYLLLSGGYALVEGSTADTRDKHYLQADGTFSEDSTGPYTGLTFIKNTVKHSAGGKYFYYYAPLDSEYNIAVGLGEVIPTFSKQMASTIYIKTDDEASATLAFYDKKLIAKDELPDDATAPKYVEAIVGVLCNKDGIYAGSTKWFANAFSIEYIQQQSAPALKAFAVHDVKVNSLDTALKEFTISDMMDVAPDSLFDDPGIKDKPIDQLSGAFQEKLKTMTIQNILDWGNITTLSPSVLSIIGEATLEDFFASLSYSAVDGDIHVNIVTLYESIYARQNDEG